jgi:N6-adenosine-specific RNA methylase IME4
LYKFHPLADLFPLLSEGELQELANDIRERGLLEPIQLLDGMILDGRNRYAACMIARVEPVFVEFTEDDALGFVISKNIHRRHLNESQRAVVAAKIANMTHGGNRKPESQEANLPLDPVVTQDIAADMLNVSARSIRSVKAIERDAPELIPQIESGNITVHEAQKEIKAKRREKEVEAIKAEPIAPVPDGQFRVLVLDPPWPYGTKYDPDGRRCANPYPEMTLKEIESLPIAERAHDDCVLFLWTTHKFMRYSFGLLDAWGFRDVSIITWVKDRMGVGSWLRSQTEFCIMAVRGNPVVTLTNQTTVLNGPMREHSRKPDEFWELVKSLCHGTVLEFFGREQREGVVTWGNETGKFVEDA